ncbi:MAG: hypothetical protein V7L01_29990 [Nostoc sp.]
MIFYRLIDGGVEVVRFVSGYRDLETVFLKLDLTKAIAFSNQYVNKS